MKFAVYEVCFGALIMVISTLLYIVKNVLYDVTVIDFWPFVRVERCACGNNLY